MSISSSWDVSSDAELITAVRSGDAAAFGVLYERHSGAARSVAGQYSNSAADADDSVAEAFSRVFTAIQTGGGPDVAFRAYLFTVIRRVALKGAHSGRRTQTTDDLDVLEAAFGLGDSTEDPTFAGFERSVVSRAYKSLPERWQAVLWYTEVEQLNAAQIAPVLGLSANGVAALAYRAREGLRQAYLQQHLASPASEACTIINAKFGAYVRGGLAKRETALVESHLEECGDCRALILELGDVNHGMRAIIAPLVLGAVAIGVLHGVGFGGAIGGAAATAGAGAGAGAGMGGGAAGGSAGAGAGSLVGAGTSGFAGAGVVAGGVAALAAAGTPSAAGSTATSGAAGGAGAASGATGLAGLVGSVPVGALGLAAAGLVVALAVGFSGMLGLFSGDDAPSIADPITTTDELPDDVTPPSDDPADDPADVPADVPGASAAIPASVPPSTQTAPPAGSTTPPPTTPDDPPPPPPAPLVVTSDLGSTNLVAGLPQLVEIQVQNPGSTSVGPVHTELTFPAGSGVVVDTLAAAALGGPGAVVPFAATADWACAVVITAEADTVTCSVAEIAAGATSTLRTTISVEDAVIDGESELEVGTRTWAEPGAAPAPTTSTIRVASAPARLSVVGPSGPDAYLRSDVPRDLTFTATNTGRTTATGLTTQTGMTAVVDLPEAIFWAGEVPGSDWTCTGTVGSNAPVTCELDPAATLAPGASRDLVVRVRSEGAGTREITGTIEAANGRGGIASGTTTVVVTSVTGSLAVYADPVTIEPGGVSKPVPITVVNLGDAVVTGLHVTVSKTAGPLTWSPPSPADPAWACASTGQDVACTPADRSLAPGEWTTLEPRVQTPANADAKLWDVLVTVRVDGLILERLLYVNVER